MLRAILAEPGREALPEAAVVRQPCPAQPTAGWRRWVLGLLLACQLALAAAAEGRAAPRALSPAERHAAAHTLEYLRGGAASWWPLLAGDSPLRGLGREAAVREIEVRAGPAEGSVWELQTSEETVPGRAVFRIEFPSGMTETLVLELLDSGGGWRIRTIRAASDRAPRPQAAAAAVPAAETSPVDRSAARHRIAYGGGMVAAAAGWLLWLLVTRRRGRWLVPAGGLLAAGLFLLIDSPPAPAPERAADAGAFEPTMDQPGTEGLLALRRAMTRSGAPSAGAPDPGDLLDLPVSSAAARTARLWQARERLLRQDLNAAQEILEAFPSDSDVPAVHLLRARLELLRFDATKAALAYRRAVESGIVHDGLLLEAARAHRVLGFEDRAGRLYERLERLGSRHAETYYDQAVQGVLDRALLRAEGNFITAWRLRPVRRTEVLADVVAMSIVETSESLQKLVALDAVSDPVVGCDAGEQALAVPPEARARRLGSLLVIELAQAELRIPGGCALAPPGTEALDAAEWTRRSDRRLLADLGEITAAARSPGAVARGREINAAAEALSRRRRWRDLIALTDGLPEELAGIPSELILRRAEALSRTGRRAAARSLLNRLLEKSIASRHLDLRLLYQLADLLIAAEQYDLALDLIGRIDRKFSFPFNENLIRRAQVEKRVAKLQQEYSSGRFRVVYPMDRSHYFARAVVRILEGEWRRLAKWIPIDPEAAAPEKIEVYLLPVADFRMAYSENLDIVGLYDGRIRLPLAEVRELPGELISIITHELAHAMIAQATDDMAPRWLHEGLAQHVEPVQESINPIPALLAREALLPFPLIDAVLESPYSMIMIHDAYQQARWALHFVDSRYGARAIRGLIEAFAGGMTSEEAVAEVLGKSIAQFDEEMRAWWLHDAPSFWPSEGVEYSRQIY